MGLLRTVGLLLITLFFYGCGTTYAPTGDYGGFPHGGYGETRLSTDKYMVYFSGNTFVPFNQAKSYLLYRSAQLTVDNGYGYFVMLSTNTSNENMALQTSSSYHPVASIPGTYSRSVQLEGYQVTNSHALPQDTTKIHGTSAVIQMFQGHAPPNMPNAYNASDILAHQGPPP